MLWVIVGVVLIVIVTYGVGALIIAGLDDELAGRDDDELDSD